jgi:hypothetical protein
VRTAYLVPSNRAAQPNAVAIIRQMIYAWQAWLCERTAWADGVARQMRIETEADGFTPRVHVANLTVTDATLRTDIWSQTIQAATNAGVPVWTTGQVWWLIPEAHLQQSDGSIVGGVALGASFGSGDDPGVAMLGSIVLALQQAGSLTDLRAYHQMVIPAIGPYPLVQDLSFPWFEGTTLSSVISSAYGAGIHEILHALGVAHDSRNDANARGNVMYNGLRGFRAVLYPAQFPTEETRLEYATALALRHSRYLKQCETPWPLPPSGPDNVRPQVTVFTQGTVMPTAGLLAISVQVQDDRALGTLLLDREGDTVGELPLSGTSAALVLRTPFYATQQATQYGVTVLDRAGNRQRVTTTITVAAGNRAPVPDFRVTPPSPAAGMAAQLDAGASRDPENGALLFEWDLDGDGGFDTPRSSNPVHTAVWYAPGSFLVRVRVTDPVGAQSVSTPICVLVRPADTSVAHSPYGDGTPGCTGRVVLRANLLPALATSQFGFATRGAPASAAGLLWLSLQTRVNCLALGSACLHLEPAGSFATLPAVADMEGDGFVSLPIPASLGLRGLTFAAQTLWLEGGGCQITAPRWSTSNGLALRLL